MKMPPLKNPQRYIGLYAFDFGDWVSAGYTAEEVDMLLGSSEYKNGQAYRIYRVDSQDRVELVGISPNDLLGESMMLFASTGEDQARRDYDSLFELARQRPLMCSVEMVLTELSEGEMAFGVGLIYPCHAEKNVSDWLLTGGFTGGESVSGGAEVLQEYRRTANKTLVSCVLDCAEEYKPRAKDEVLSQVREPLQR